jgi:hypothetical protein
MGCGGMGMGVVIMLSKNGFWNAQVFLFVLFCVAGSWEV